MIDLADDHFALDTTRAERLLAWKPRLNLRDTVKRDPAAWFEENGLEVPADVARVRVGPGV